MSNEKGKSGLPKDLHSLIELAIRYLEDISNDKDRADSLNKLSKICYTIRNHWEKMEKEDFSTDTTHMINLLNFMRIEKGQFEDTLLNEIRSSLMEFLEYAKTIKTETPDKIENKTVSDKHIDEETEQFLESFVIESMDGLDEAETHIEEITKEDNGTAVGILFRCFHSIKGVASFMNLETIKSVAHETEALLDILMKNNEKQSEELIDILYKSIDMLRILITNVKNKHDDLGFEKEAKALIEIVNDQIQVLQGKKAEKKDEFDFDSLNLINKETIERFTAEANELIEESEQLLVSIESDPKNKEHINNFFGNIHSLKGNSGFMNLSVIEKILMALETLFDEIRSGELKITEKIISLSLRILDIVKNSINNLDPESFECHIENDDIDKINQELQDIFGKKDYYRPLGEILIDMGATDSDTVSKALELQESLKTRTIEDTSHKQIERKDIRVDTSKLDRLFNYVGELITAEVMVVNSPDIAGLDLPSFSKAASMLSKIIRELQDTTMSIRMMPLEGLFNRMKRLVRDLSRKSNKKVNLKIFGNDIEMDKNIIEEISDPLIHILRNAIDHGLEKPEERASSGKSPEGTLQLGAKYDSNEILIIVEDDGKGLDRDTIIKKAYEKSLISPDVNIDDMPDSEVWSFIFQPGFSTAKVVSDISGRGVGMDVVRKNIEKLHGKVTVKSQKGKGSCFTMRIPITLAILEGMLVRVGTTKYSIPILSIHESLRPGKNDITRTPDEKEVVMNRNELLPIIRLHEYFEKEPEFKNIEEGILVVVEAHNKKVCLFVDEILGKQQTVVKNLSEYIGKVKGITGGMILANGEIGLILDINTIVETGLSS